MSRDAELCLWMQVRGVSRDTEALPARMQVRGVSRDAEALPEIKFIKWMMARQNETKKAELT